MRTSSQTFSLCVPLSFSRDCHVVSFGKKLEFRQRYDHDAGKCLTKKVWSIEDEPGAEGVVWNVPPTPIIDFGRILLLQLRFGVESCPSRPTKGVYSCLWCDFRAKCAEQAMAGGWPAKTHAKRIAKSTNIICQGDAKRAPSVEAKTLGGFLSTSWCCTQRQRVLQSKSGVKKPSSQTTDLVLSCLVLSLERKSSRQF